MYTEYYKQVALEAQKLGYTINQIVMFASDIQNYYQENRTVEEAVSDLF